MLISRLEFGICFTSGLTSLCNSVSRVISQKPNTVISKVTCLIGSLFAVCKYLYLSCFRFLAYSIFNSWQTVSSTAVLPFSGDIKSTSVRLSVQSSNGDGQSVRTTKTSKPTAVPLSQVATMARTE
jgi:hypothetical protein